MQRRELIQLIEHNFWIGIGFDIDHQLDRLFQVTQVFDADNAVDFVAFDQCRDLFDNRVGRLLERQFGDDDLGLAAFSFDDMAFSANGDRAAAARVRLNDSGSTANDAAGWEVGPRQDFHDLADGAIGVLDDQVHRVADFAKIVRRNRGRHTDRDTA